MKVSDEYSANVPDADDTQELQEVNNITRRFSRAQLRFEKGSAFTACWRLSAGPLIYQIGISIHDAIDLLLLTKRYESELSDVTSIVGLSSTVRYLCMSAAIFFSQACVSRVSGLIGESRFNEAAHVVTDVYRIGFCAMILVPIMFYFLAGDIVKFIGAYSPVPEMAPVYLLPILCCVPLITLFQLSCGILESEGRSILAGIMQLVAFVLNCGFLGPLFYFGFKVPFSVAGLAFGLSQSIPGIILTYLIFSGKFDTKCKWSSLLQPFTIETWHGLKMAAPFIINVLVGVLPVMFLISKMYDAAYRNGNSEFSDVFAVFLKIQPIVNSFSLGFAIGTIGLGTYARGSKNYKRLAEIFKWGFILTLILQIIFMPLLCTRGDLVFMIYHKKEEAYQLARDIIRIPFYLNWVFAWDQMTTSILVATGYHWLAMTPPLFKGVMYLVWTCVIYYTNKEDFVRMMYGYALTDASQFVYSSCLLYFPVRRVYYQIKDTQSQNGSQGESKKLNEGDV